MANAVNWFEIPATDLARAKVFYESALGYQLDLREMGPMKMAWFPMEQGAPYATGALVEAEGYVPSHHGTMVYISVPSIDETLERVEKHGGRVLRPKSSLGEFGFSAVIEDSEGNKVSLHSDT